MCMNVYYYMYMCVLMCNMMHMCINMYYDTMYMYVCVC